MKPVDDVLLGLSFIRRSLKNKPNRRYITPDRKLLLVLLPDDRLLSIPGNYYEDASEEFIDGVIQGILNQI